MAMRITLRSLERKRLARLRRIETLSPWLQGTLVSTARVCGKPGCACHRGGSKHPVLFVTTAENGKTASLYVPRRMEAQVRVWVANYQKLKALLRELSDIQRQIVRLREPE
jgi:hypothetical protein